MSEITGTTECPDCEGTGDGGDGWYCRTCEGMGSVDEYAPDEDGDA